MPARILTFDVRLHARPDETSAGGVVALRGCESPTLTCGAEGAPWQLSFEEACARLQKLPRMFLEPDGSFVWVAETDAPRWQVDGQILDRAGRLLLVELHGTSSGERFDALLTCLGWPAQPCVFELVREGVWLDEAAFRSYAALAPVTRRGV